MKTKVGWFLAATKLNKSVTKRDRYEAFLQRLPKELSQIENAPDDDAFTPLFNKHCQNLEDFGAAVQDDKDWVKRQRKEFKSCQLDYEKRDKRNIYMTNVLTNWGIGNNNGLKEQEQVRRITQDHKARIRDHVESRNQMIHSV